MLLAHYGKQSEFDNMWWYVEWSAVAVVVAQLVQCSLSTPEFRGLNPDISKILSCTIEKRKIKKKRLGMAHLKKC